MGFEEIPLRSNGQTVTADWFNAIRTYGIGSISTYTAYAGGGQANATSLTTDICRITTCATNADSVKLPTSANNKRVLVINETAQTLAVYPASGEQINALSANASISIDAYGSMTFFANTSTKWVTTTKLGSITNSDVSASAAIAYSKLNLSNSIVNADVSTSAAITYSKLNRSVVTKTVANNGQSLTAAESGVVLLNSSGGAFTLNLPTAVGNTGLWYEFKKTTNDFTVCTIDGNGSETIDGSLTKKLNTQHERMKIISDGSNWQVLERSYYKSATTYTMSVYGSTLDPQKATSPAKDLAIWTRDGDSIVIQYIYSQTSSTGANDGTGIYIFGLPSGLTPDTSKIDTSGIQAVGSCYFRGNAATTEVYGSAIAYDVGGGKVGVLLGGILESGGAAQSMSTTAGYGFSTNATLRMGFIARIPITNWE